MNEQTIMLALIVWCMVGWLWNLVRSSSIRYAMLVYLERGYYKTVLMMGVLAIVAWPFAPVVTAVVGSLNLHHPRSKR